MTAGRASSVWWSAFTAAGVAAAFSAQAVQLAFAGLAIGLLGLPHGASDLAVVPRNRRASFLLAYLGCIVLVVLLWQAVPSIALGLLLALSAGHFALDDDPARGALHRVALGGFLIGGPALFHHAAIIRLFYEATASHSAAQDLAGALQITGILATAALITANLAGPGKGLRHGREIAVIAGTLVMPPLVGFALAFVLLHARGQTRERQREIGCATLSAYLLRTAPVLGGAVMVLVLMSLGLAAERLSDPTLLFAGIAALATPHMLVTPLWRRTTSCGWSKAAGLA